MKLTRESGWSSLLSHFGLPEVFADSQTHGNSSVARTLSQYYFALLSPFEEAYLRNMQQQKVMHSQQQQMRMQPQQHSQPQPQPQPQPQQQQQQQQQQRSIAFPGHNVIDSASFSSPSQQPQVSGRLPITSYPHPKPDLPQQASTGGFEQDQHTAPSLHGSDTLGINQVSPINPPSTQTQATAPLTSNTPQAVLDGNTRNGSGGVNFPALPQSDDTSSDVDGKKRKLQEEDQSKRVRQKTGTLHLSRCSLLDPQSHSEKTSQSLVNNLDQASHKARLPKISLRLQDQAFLPHLAPRPPIHRRHANLE